MHISIEARAFSPSDALNAFLKDRSNVGACVSFTGLVREDSEVTALELEHYPGFTEAQIQRLAELSVQRHGADDVLIIHRIGMLAVGEPIVLVAVLAAHRRSAFRAAEEIMDRLKVDAPFWKREWRGDTSQWIEPTMIDIEQRMRHGAENDDV